jgi:hypothetical protein
MGNNCFSGKSKLVFFQKDAKKIYEMLLFIDDEDKTEKENLIDCMADFFVQFHKVENDYLYFVVNNSESPDDFDWNLMLSLLPFLAEESFYEEIGDEMVVGKIIIENGEKFLIRDIHEFDYDKNDKPVRV